MKIDKIVYQNFRNIEYAEIYPGENTTVFYGKNGQGKTNGLEGIYYFARGKSFRTNKDQELLKFGEKESSIKLYFEDKSRKQNINIKWHYNGRKKIVTKNNVSIKKMSEIIGLFRAVLFCPGHLAIVNQGPSERRNFLDIAISQLDPIYLSSLQKYYKICFQKNSLIKNIKENKKGIPEKTDIQTNEVLSQQQIEESVIISRKREEYIKKLNLYVDNFFKDITKGRENTMLVYEGENNKEALQEKVNELFYKEIKYGACLYGIHKDDIKIYMNEREARNYASQGQQRTIALAMKMAEGEISKNITGEYPIFLLDDIMSELDKERRDYLYEGLNNKQVIITTCDYNNNNGKIYIVKDGKYKIYT